MTVLRGKIRGGQVVLDGLADLPDDTEVVVTLAEGDGPMDAAEIARVLEAMAQSVPLGWTDEQHAEWAAQRKEQKR